MLESIKELVDNNGKSICYQCTKKWCCNYVAFQIDTPKEADEFDDLLWQISHENISFFIDEGDWYINIASRCRHLGPKGECGIYETRPSVCREYSNHDCEFHGQPYGFQREFADYDSLLKYVFECFPNYSKRFNRKQKVEIIPMAKP